MPWAGNDASPWIRTGIATRGSCRPARVPRSVCSARVRPSTTGSTASRWLGFAARVTVSSPASVERVPSAPRWYLTSPAAPSASSPSASSVRSPSNSRRIVSYGRPAVCAMPFSLPQPHALLVVGDVLDLVRARAGVGLAQMREHVGERLAGHAHAEDVGRDSRLELARQLRLEPLGLERGIADGLRAERVEVRGEV